MMAGHRGSKLGDLFWRLVVAEMCSWDGQFVLRNDKLVTIGASLRRLHRG